MKYFIKHKLKIVFAITSRLGLKSNKPRPLKTTLYEPSDDFILLKIKHKLHTSSIYDSFRISPDRTIMQPIS